MGYYVEGLGTFENEPLVTRDENGNRVVQSAGLVRKGTLNSSGGLSRSGGDKLASSYDYAREDTKSLLSKWKSSRYGTTEREKAVDGLFRVYKARGDYKGTRDDFEQWLNQYHSDMINSALVWNGGFKGIPTVGADGQPLRGAPERTGGGTSTAGLYQKAGNPYSSFGLKW